MATIHATVTDIAAAMDNNQPTDEDSVNNDTSRRSATPNHKGHNRG
jgi:hypothetical protein